MAIWAAQKGSYSGTSWRGRVLFQHITVICTAGSDLVIDFKFTQWDCFDSFFQTFSIFSKLAPEVGSDIMVGGSEKWFWLFFWLELFWLFGRQHRRFSQKKRAMKVNREELAKLSLTISGIGEKLSTPWKTTILVHYTHSNGNQRNVLLEVEQGLNRDVPFEQG